MTDRFRPAQQPAHVVCDPHRPVDDDRPPHHRSPPSKRAHDGDPIERIQILESLSDLSGNRKRPAEEHAFLALFRPLVMIENVLLGLLDTIRSRVDHLSSHVEHRKRSGEYQGGTGDAALM